MDIPDEFKDFKVIKLPPAKPKEGEGRYPRAIRYSGHGGTAKRDGNDANRRTQGQSRRSNRPRGRTKGMRIIR